MQQQQDHAASLSQFFDGPIGALSTFYDEISNRLMVCFASGNHIFVREAGGDSDSATTGGHDSCCLEWALPYGSIVTSLACSGEWLIAGAGDRLFGQRVVLSSCFQSDGPKVLPPGYKLLPEGSSTGRIMSLTYDQTGVFLAVTAHNVLHIVDCAALNSQASSKQLATQSICGPQLPLVLAADAMSIQDNHNGGFAVFAGTYGGRVTVWKVAPCPNEITVNYRSPCVSVQSVIAAHTSGCAALFSVRAIRVRGIRSGKGVKENPCSPFAVATCSDDRSVGIFVADTLTTTAWRCAARETGPDFSQTRVFDVALVEGTSTTTAPSGTLHYAAASEDGSVSVFKLSIGERSVSEVNEERTAITSTRILMRSNVHGGHGSCRVALATVNGAVVVLSGGFDGTVTCTSISDTLNHGAVVDVRQVASASSLSTSRQSAAAVTETSGEAKRSVRGVYTSPSTGTTFFAFSTEIFSFQPKMTNGNTNAEEQQPRSHPRLVASWASHAVSGQNAKALFCSAMMSLPLTDVVVAGTDGGHLVVAVPRPSPPTAAVSPQSPCVEGTTFVLSTWLQYKKCLQLRLAAGRGWDAERCCGTFWVLSAHAGRSCLLTRVSVTAMADTATGTGRVDCDLVIPLGGINGLELTAMELYCDSVSGQVLAAVGDKRGVVTTFLLSEGDFDRLANTTMPSDSVGAHSGAAPATLNHHWSRHVFGTPVHTVSLYTTPTTNSVDNSVLPRAGDAFSQFLAVSTDDGAFSVVNRLPHDATSHAVNRVAMVAPRVLRLPFAASRVLAFTATVCIVQHGTVIAVYESPRGDHLWSCVDEFTGVKAPRLVHVGVVDTEGTMCSAQRPTYSVTHCSDGNHVEAFIRRGDSPPPGAGGTCRTRILQHSVNTGKDFNCTLHVPSLAAVLHGNEDGSLCIEPMVASDGRHRVPRAVVQGGHNSNILAMCDVATTTDTRSSARIVTVGGLATAVLWEWSAEHRLEVADVAVLLSSPSGLADTSTMKASGKRARPSDEAVPRLLCALCPCPDMVIVGGSDARLRVVRVGRPSNSTPSTGRSCLRFSMFVDSSTRVGYVNNEHPKPITALCSLTPVSCSEGPIVFAAGDTNGWIYVVNIAQAEVATVGGDAEVSGSVVCRLYLEQSAVNALTKQATSTATSDAHLLAAIHDSGNVRLMGFSHGDGRVTAPTLTPLAVVSTGLTAGRGVLWVPPLFTPGHTPSSADHEGWRRLIAVNEERLVIFNVTEQGTCAEKAERLLSTTVDLAVQGSTRVTTRCVSGMTLACHEGWSSAANGSMPAQCRDCDQLWCVVVGQGIERIRIT